MELYLPTKYELLKIDYNGRFLPGHVPANKGRKMNEEVRNKIKHSWFKKGDSRIRSGFSGSGVNKKPVLMIIENKEIYFESSMDAERKMGIIGKNIREVCKGRRKIAGGFGWEYAK